MNLIVCSSGQTRFYQLYCVLYIMKILHVEDSPEISQIFAAILSSKNYDFIFRAHLQALSYQNIPILHDTLQFLVVFEEIQ